jgi:hypothetical protein
LFSNWILLSSGSRTCCKEGHQGSKSQTSKKTQISSIWLSGSISRCVPQYSNWGRYPHQGHSWLKSSTERWAFHLPAVRVSTIVYQHVGLPTQIMGWFQRYFSNSSAVEVLHGHTCYVFVYMYFCWQEAMGIDTDTYHLQLCCSAAQHHPQLWLSWITPNIRYPKRDTMGCLVSLRSKTG